MQRAFLALFMSAVLATPTNAADGAKPCYGLLEERGLANSSLDRAEAPLMTENQCEAQRQHELRLELLKIPQDREDPMSVSVGTKGDAGLVRFKIPFSF